MSTAYPFARPLYVMAKASGPLCNLRCQYCYYLEKQYLTENKKMFNVQCSMETE